MKNIIKWLANGEVGESSKTMAIVALGELPRERSHPRDPDDLNRCIKLVAAAPEVIDAFPAIRVISTKWAAVIDNWEELRDLFIEEVGFNWSKGSRAAKTYNRMKELYGERDRAKVEA